MFIQYANTFKRVHVDTKYIFKNKKK